MSNLEIIKKKLEYDIRERNKSPKI